MWCNVGFAETMNELLDDNYKITKKELVKFDTYAYKIFTLKKGRNVIVCSVSIYSTGVRTTSRCMTP